MRTADREVRRRNALQGLGEMPWVGGAGVVIGLVVAVLSDVLAGATIGAMGLLLVGLFAVLVRRRRAQWDVPTKWDLPRGWSMNELVLRPQRVGISSDPHEEGFRWVLFALPDGMTAIFPGYALDLPRNAYREVLAREEVIIGEYPNGSLLTPQSSGGPVPFVGETALLEDATAQPDPAFAWSPDGAWRAAEDPDEGEAWELGTWNDFAPTDTMPAWFRGP